MKQFRQFAQRLVWAAGAVAAARLILGISVPLPSGAVLTEYVGRAGTPLLKLYNWLGGGSLAKGSAFALGIMPYLSARVFMLLAERARSNRPPLSEGQRKWWTRGLTVGLSLVQSYGYARFTQNLSGAVSQPGLAYTVEVMAMLTSVSTLVMLFAEEATSAGEKADAPLLPRERAEPVAKESVRDPLYVSHPTPIP